MDMLFQGAVAVVAVAVAFWPQIAAWLKSLMPAGGGGTPSPAKPVAPKPVEPVVVVSDSPSYQEAIAHLASVRLRLLRTDRLDEERKKAIDTITLALVDGSDH